MQQIKTAACDAITRKLLIMNRSQAWLARELGVTRHAVSQWVNGRRRPSLEVMSKIETLIGVSTKRWVLPEERK